jgi:hypothetical protein
MPGIQESAATPAEPRASFRRRIVLTTFGSLGDLHPYIAIALGLQARGHEAVIATSGYYRLVSSLAKHGLSGHDALAELIHLLTIQVTHFRGQLWESLRQTHGHKVLEIRRRTLIDFDGPARADDLNQLLKRYATGTHVNCL